MYIYPHKKEWKQEYVNQSNLILSSYGEGIQLHHIGSTSIEGLFAKDCIDILGVVKDLLEVKKRKKSITDLGYIYKGEFGIPDREYFSKSFRKVHLHIYKVGDLNVQKHLHFVEALRGNTQLIEELNILKKHLQLKYPSDKNAYQREKEHFYKHIHEML